MTAVGRRYGGLSAADRDAHRRRRLLDAALDLFAGQGYAATTIEQVCRRARVTARNLYDHFDGREALLRAVYDEIVADVVRAVADALERARPQGDAVVRAALSAFVEAMVSDPRRARVNFVEAVGVSPALEARRREVLRQFRDLILQTADDLVARGVAEDRDHGLVATALVGATQELLVDWTYRDDRPSPEVVVDELVRLYRCATGMSPEGE